MSDPVVKFIAEARRRLQEQAEAAMTMPKSDPFEHGVQVGRYQGAQSSLDLLTAILKESDQ